MDPGCARTSLRDRSDGDLFHGVKNNCRQNYLAALFFGYRDVIANFYF